ncbi:DUF4365 domain-containing protein [Streptomyces sp. RKAG293]|uniref:DUF4365 domain-containing protein n=1 Tax=Streptomyces sp. RKAG293 TaxID=2893403 RepID=UPI002033ED28|nr:DUF4365 domain-containing protein [Streptomyces sp. RKAG293]
MGFWPCHIAVQVKSGPSFFDKRQSPNGWWFPFGDGHGQYWLHHDFPVIVVLVDLESGIGYWQAVTADTVMSTGEGWKVEVPSAQRLDGSALAALFELAEAPRVQGDSILAEFYTNLDHLPPEAARPLRRLHASVPRTDLSARRPIERLAATLASKRSDPDGCCGLLLEKTPNWLHRREDDKPEWRGPDEREVWVAVGGYANEYGLPARAAEAYRRAAAAGSQPEGYWRAVGGLFEVEIAQEQAKETLEAAGSRVGGRILVDIGLAILAHRGQPGPVPVPSSLLPQTAAD